jgi:hypothetical protein
MYLRLWGCLGDVMPPIIPANMANVVNSNVEFRILLLISFIWFSYVKRNIRDFTITKFTFFEDSCIISTHCTFANSGFDYMPASPKLCCAFFIEPILVCGLIHRYNIFSRYPSLNIVYIVENIAAARLKYLDIASNIRLYFFGCCKRQNML